MLDGMVTSETQAKRPGRQPRMTPRQCVAAAGRYAAGETVRELAAAYKVAYGTMHRVLREAGVTMRGRNGKS
jgi:helix-turn-helix protein